MTTRHLRGGQERTFLEALLFGLAVISGIAATVFLAVDLCLSAAAGRFESAELLLGGFGLAMSAGLWFMSRLARRWHAEPPAVLDTDP